MIKYAPGLKIMGWGDTDYEGQVRDLLDTVITKNAVGKVILKAIADVNKDKNTSLAIRPYTAAYADENKLNRCGALTESLDNPAANEKDQPILQGGNDDLTTKTGEKGTGKGSETDVRFTPGQWGKSAPCSQGLIAALPDEVLLHEMVHGLRRLQGKRNALPTAGALKDYENEEEFLAIVIANIYLSVKGTTQLRGGFDSSIELDPKLSTSAGFLTEPANVKLLTKFKGTDAEGPLFNDLNLVTGVKFNPINELLKPKKK
jgi:hypothetical protein